MASITVSFNSTLINPANFFIAALYDTSNLSVILEQDLIPKGAGYVSPFGQTFSYNANPSKLYRVILWENTVGIVGGTARVSGDIKPSLTQTTLRSDKFYTYGISPEFTNATTIVDSSLIGWTGSFEQFGSGTLKPATDYTFDNTTGTIVLINGTTYMSGQEMIFHFQPSVSASAPVSSGISSGRIITTTASLSSTDSNSDIYLQGSAGSFVVTLPALSTMTDYQPIEFFSFGGNHVNATLLCAGTDKIQWNALITNIILGQSEMVTMFKANGVWNVKYPPSGINAAGEIVLNYSKTEINTIFANGALYSRTTYPRLWAYVQSLEPGCIVTDATWTSTSVVNGITYFANKAKFTVGDGSTNFRVPLLYNYGSLKAVDGATRFPGNLQTGQVGAFTAPVPIPMGDSFLGLGPYTIVGRGAANPGTLTPSISFNAGLENYPTNTGVYALIRI